VKEVSRIIKHVLGGAAIGTGLLALWNVARARWVYSGVDAILAIAFAALYYTVARWPRSARSVGGVMAGMIVVVPSLLVVSPGSEMDGSAVAVLGVSAVLLLSLLWPAAGVVGAGVETVILALLSLAGELPWLVVMVFAIVAAVINVFARSWSGALTRAEAGQAEVARKNQELEQALQRLTVALEQERKLVATIRELETPLIESEQGGGMSVVVGYCDANRVQAIQDALLSRLQQRSLQRLIIDISGARFDKAGSAAFVQALQALRLMVPDVVISGMSPEQAKELARDRERVHLMQRTITFVHSLQEAFTSQSL